MLTASWGSVYFGNKSYYVPERPKHITFDQASKFCNKRGMQLPEFENSDFRNLLVSKFWVGATLTEKLNYRKQNRKNQKIWVWINSGVTIPINAIHSRDNSQECLFVAKGEKLYPENCLVDREKFCIVCQSRSNCGELEKIKVGLGVRIRSFPKQFKKWWELKQSKERNTLGEIEISRLKQELGAKQKRQDAFARKAWMIGSITAGTTLIFGVFNRHACKLVLQKNCPQSLQKRPQEKIPKPKLLKRWANTEVVNLGCQHGPLHSAQTLEKQRVTPHLERQNHHKRWKEKRAKSPTHLK